MATAASSFRKIDYAAIGGFLVVWIVSMVANLAAVDRPAANWVYVEALSGGDHPTVQGYLRPDAETLTDLRRGDRVIRVGDVDVAGRGQIRFLLTVSEVSWRTTGDVAFTVERQGQRVSLSVPRVPRAPAAVYKGVIIAFVWGFAALVVRVRARRSATTQAIWAGLACYAVFYTANYEGPWALRAFSLATLALATWGVGPLLVRTFLSFPEEANALTGWNRVWPWLFVITANIQLSWATAFPMSAELARSLAIVPVAPWLAALLFVVSRNYRRSGPVGRRQLKWIAYSVYAGVLLSLVSMSVTGPAPIDPPLWTEMLIVLASISYPVLMLVAILRSNLFDIDRLFGATVSYNLLGFVGVGLAFLFLPSLTEALVQTLDVAPTNARGGVALSLTGLVVVAQKRVRPRVERLLFRERFALEQAMKSLPEVLATARSPEQLWRMTGDELAANLRPSSCVIFSAAEVAFVPVHTDGETVPPIVPRTADLVGLLEGLGSARHVDRRLQREAGALGSAVLSNIEAAVVFPVRRSGKLEAFVCLGEKHSGDVYTSTDLTLLSALSTSLSLLLLRFDEAELLERSRSIQQQMQRYVPGALAEEISLGHEIETGEREVSVLFVDIRGYTSYSQSRDVSEVFSTVNAYTQTTSSVVTEFGGVIVEFNGDGMMAVFGAPRRLDHKEHAAVAAARRLVELVPTIGGSEEPLTVGVGVATGAAFVGNIEAVDRTIWSAIGTTTNLAARLQTLTRSLDVGVLIDATTYAQASDAVEGFEPRPGTTVRGLSETQTVYAL